MLKCDVGYYVYFITDNNGAMKIGKSKNPWRRLCELQLCNSNKLEVVTAFALPSKREMDDLEKRFHVYFKDCNLVGEWFKYEIVINWLHNIHELDGYEFEKMSDKDVKDYMYDFI